MLARFVSSQKYRFTTLVLCTWFSLLWYPALAQNIRLFEDNADSIAVLIGNKSYRQTVSVDFAYNDADAMRDFLIRSLGFRDGNIFVLKDATLSEFNQMFGSERNPQSGRLWRAVKEGYSNVFVYFSGHGAPDLQTRQPFLLPSDGDPNLGESGFPLDLLYRNLELVKRKIGANRQVIVMIDACFTGETGRKGESLLTASTPGFTPARPRTGSAVVKLLATSASSPANWDQENRLGLFTSRFLLGAAGLARASDAGVEAKPDLTWGELRRFVINSVTEGARREIGREQVPEIDDVAFTLKADGPVPAIERGYGRMRDEGAWRAAEAAGTVAAFETYIARCGAICAFKDKALSALIARRHAAAAEADAASWQRLSAVEKYQEYLDGCGRVCAYREIARSYLGAAPAPPPAAAPVTTAVVAPPVAPAVPAANPCSGPVTASFPSRCAAPLTAEQERRLKPKDAFRECEKCPEMVVVPAGTFTMGSGPDGDIEGPQHRVALGRPVAVGKFSVTFDEWDACIADGGCNGYRPGDMGWGRGLRPVIQVSWDDAQTYLAWLSTKTGKAYRLLSEAEREYVTRAGTTTPFWWGSSISTQQANYNGHYSDINSLKTDPQGEFRQQTLPVDSFAPNPWGLHQVHGNVFEWTGDCSQPGYNGAPSDGSARTTGDCGRREARGGSWSRRPGQLLATFRYAFPSSERNNEVGFRVARALLTPVAPEQPAVGPTPARRPDATPVAVRTDTPPDAASTFYAGENVDFRVLPQSALKKEVGNPTPLAIPGATTITTMDLKKAMDAGRPMILIDALQDRHALTIKGAFAIPWAGAFGTFHDQVQTRLANALTNLLRGRPDASLIFFCEGAKCWESYNAALRARAAGFQRVSWYRGGLNAWKEAGLPMQPAGTLSVQ